MDHRVQVEPLGNGWIAGHQNKSVVVRKQMCSTSCQASERKANSKAAGTCHPIRAMVAASQQIARLVRKCPSHFAGAERRTGPTAWRTVHYGSRRNEELGVEGPSPCFRSCWSQSLWEESALQASIAGIHGVYSARWVKLSPSPNANGRIKRAPITTTGPISRTGVSIEGAAAKAPHKATGKRRSRLNDRGIRPAGRAEWPEVTAQAATESRIKALNSFHLTTREDFQVAPVDKREYKAASGIAKL